MSTLRKLQLAKRENTSTNEAIKSITSTRGTDTEFTFTFIGNEDAIWCMRALLLVARSAKIKVTQAQVKLGNTPKSLILKLN